MLRLQANADFSTIRPWLGHAKFFELICQDESLQSNGIAGIPILINDRPAESERDGGRSLLRGPASKPGTIDSKTLSDFLGHGY